jgi:cytochrome c-type biogenesis protein CcmH
LTSHGKTRQGRRGAARALMAIGVLVAIGLWAQRAHVARGTEAVSFEDIEESLTCQCGCGLTVHSCNHLQCPSAIPLREEIRAQMRAGKGKTAILAYFANKYGEKILSSPTTSGFNLVAWLTPFVAVTIGGVLVGVTVLRWSRRRRAVVQQVPSAHPPAESPYSKIMEKELKDFEG